MASFCREKLKQKCKARKAYICLLGLSRDDRKLQDILLSHLGLVFKRSQKSYPFYFLIEEPLLGLL